MRSTPYHHYALYEADAAPDLTVTGEYNSAIMGIDADLHAEETERKAANTVLGANSADLTGIKGLTYGPQHINFLESHNGEYTSPALEEIAEQIAQGMTCIKISSNLATLSADSLSQLRSDWPNVALIETTDISSSVGYNILLPVVAHESEYVFSPISGSYSDDGAPYNHFTKISVTGDITRDDMSRNPYWANITNKPFSTIGTGLKVVSDALTVDTGALPSGLTVISISETDQAADVYAKVQAAWPNCVLSGNAIYYPYTELPAVGSQTHGYLFTANGGGTTSAWNVTATGMTHMSDDLAPANTTFGDFTKAVTA